MKRKHLLFSLLAILVVLSCVLSIVAVIAYQNHNPTATDLSEKAQPITVTIENDSLSDGEKISLITEYKQEFSSVTCTNQMKGHTAMTEEEAKQSLLSEIVKLSKLLPLGDIDEADFYSYAEKNLVNQSIVPCTYVDRDSPSRYAIVWIITLEFKSDFVSAMMDDETGKIYEFTVGKYDERRATVPSYRKLKQTVEGFAAYLGLELTTPQNFYEDYHSFGDGDVFVVYTSKYGITLPYQITLWGSGYVSVTLPSGKSLADIQQTIDKIEMG